MFIQVTGVSVMVLLCSNIKPYVQNVMQAAYLNNYWGMNPQEPNVQWVLSSQFINVLADYMRPVVRPVCACD